MSNSAHTEGMPLLQRPSRPRGPHRAGARYNHGLNPLAANEASKFFLSDPKNASAQVYLALALGKRD